MDINRFTNKNFAFVSDADHLVTNRYDCIHWIGQRSPEQNDARNPANVLEE